MRWPGARRGQIAWRGRTERRGPRRAAPVTDARRDPSRSVEGLRREGSDEEGGHLLTEDGVVGAVEERGGLTSAGDAGVVEGLDEVGGKGTDGDVAEDADGRRRDVGGAVLGLQEEDGHLGSSNGGGGAVIAAAATGGDALG